MTKVVEELFLKPMRKALNLFDKECTKNIKQNIKRANKYDKRLMLVATNTKTWKEACRAIRKGCK